MDGTSRNGMPLRNGAAATLVESTIDRSLHEFDRVDNRGHEEREHRFRDPRPHRILPRRAVIVEKSAALDSVRAAPGEGNGEAPRRGRGRRTRAASSSPDPARRRRGGKRSFEDVQKTADALLAYVKGNEGRGSGGGLVT